MENGNTKRETYAHDVLDRVILIVAPRRQQREPVRAQTNVWVSLAQIPNSLDWQRETRTSRWYCPVLLPDIAARRRGFRRRSLPILKPVSEDRKGRRNLLGVVVGSARAGVTQEEHQEKAQVSQRHGMERGSRGAGSVKSTEGRGGGSSTHKFGTRSGSARPNSLRS